MTIDFNPESGWYWITTPEGERIGPWLSAEGAQQWWDVATSHKD
jgi:hypothetical protein